ncbi:MAG TPA: collagenase-like protease, partial [Casimicrobium sp.]|nr:collagenase-like protease [Casimicrobium sp.]
MTLPKNHLELLSPARDAEIGRQAVLHGADAVYIGGPSFGARSKADNSVADIAALASFAHRYGSRIFVTVNTILHDNELESARRYIHELYDAGVDALIVQD